MSPARRAAWSAALLSLLAAVPALADDVRLKSYYPVPYGEYDTAEAQNYFEVGSATSAAVGSTINGSVAVTGGSAVIKKSNTGWLRVCPFTGPNSADVLRIDENENVSIGSNTIRTYPPKLKAHTVMKGSTLRALGNPADSPTVYGLIRAYKDDTQSTEHLKRMGQFCSLATPAPPAGTADTFTYGKMRLEAKIVQFGPSYTQRSGESSAGVTGAILIDSTTPVQDPYGTPELYLQVGNPLAVGDPPLTTGDARSAAIEDPGAGGNSWREFSSRDFKKDIVPVLPDECSRALTDIASTDVVRYRFKSAPSRERLGLIAEDLPAAIRAADGKSLNLSEAFAYAAAALKELKTRNESLRARVSSLEKRKAALAR